MPLTSATARNEASQLLSAYLDKHDGNAGKMKDLKDLLTGHHDFQAPELRMPISEYEERIALAAKLESILKRRKIPFRLNAVMFSALMVAPLGRLRGLLNSNDENTFAKILRDGLSCVHDLLRVFFRGPGTAFRAVSARANTSSSSVSSKRLRSDDSGVSSRESRPLARDRGEREDALLRDKEVCIITGTSCPQVCHIVPFSWTESGPNCQVSRMAMFNVASILWDADDLADEDQDELYRAPGTADQSWNMLSLSPQLHVWWSKPYFGLEYLGQLPAEDAVVPVELRFRWLPRDQGMKPEITMNLAEERDYNRGLLSRIRDVRENPSTAARFIGSGHRVRSGHTVWVRIPAQHVARFITAIKVQWALCQVAAMCGFAENKDDVNQDSDDDNPLVIQAQLADVEARRRNVMDWLEEISKAETPSAGPAGQGPENAKPKIPPPSFPGLVERSRDIRSIPKPKHPPADADDKKPRLCRPGPSETIARPRTAESGKHTQPFSPQRAAGARRRTAESGKHTQPFSPQRVAGARPGTAESGKHTQPFSPQRVAGARPRTAESGRHTQPFGTQPFNPQRVAGARPRTAESGKHTQPFSPQRVAGARPSTAGSGKHTQPLAVLSGLAQSHTKENTPPISRMRDDMPEEV